MGDLVRRGTTWYIRYKDAQGRRRMRASHQPSKELARRYLLEVEGRIARGLVGIPERAPAAPTVAALVKSFLVEYRRPQIKDLERYRADAGKCLRRALPHIGSRLADTLTAEDIGRLRDKLLETHAPGSVRVALAYLGTLYMWAIKRKIVHGSPLVGVERPRAAASLDFFSREEVSVLLRDAGQRASTPGLPADKLLACCVQLALRTGLRKGELLGLRWRDVDLATQRLTVARSYQGLPKGGKVRHLRLPADCAPLLHEWRQVCPVGADGLVFPAPHGGGYLPHALLGLPKLLKAAGLRVPAHPWHALRHTFASHYLMQGGNLLALQQILGHSDVKNTMIYAHLAPDFLRAEMDRLKF